MKQRCTVGDRVLRNFTFLKKVATIKSKQKTLRILESATADQLLAIVEVASNILSSNFCISTRQKKRLQPYANYVRQLSRAKNESNAKKLIQKGDGAMFAALLMPVLVEAARYLIDKYVIN